MNVVVAALITGAVALLVGLVSSYFSYKGLVQKEHIALSEGHTKITHSIDLIGKDVATAEGSLGNDIVRLESLVGKDIGIINEKVTNIVEKVNRVDSSIMLNEQMQKVARDNMNDNQKTIIASVNNLASMGKEMENLSKENADLKAANTQLQEQMGILRSEMAQQKETYNKLYDLLRQQQNGQEDDEMAQEQ